MRLIRGVPPGTLNIKGFGTGFPELHNQTRAAGNGFITTTRAIYYLQGIAGNTAADSSTMVDWLIENAGEALPWSLPFVFNCYLVELRNLGNRSAICPAMLGGLPSWIAGVPDFEQWRTSTTRKRAGILVERDNAGVIRWYLSWSNGVAQASQEMLAIPNASWLSLVYQPGALAVYVNGALWSSTTAATLPTGVQTDGMLFSLGVAKKLISAAEVFVREYAPAFIPARVI